MRQHLAADGSVVPGSSYTYTPFGVVASGNTPDPFGFTGELHSQDLVYLRARWYDPAGGVFVGRDPFAGFPETPYSLHPYQYGYSNPVLWRDASGESARGYPDYVFPQDRQIVPDYATFLLNGEAVELRNTIEHLVIDLDSRLKTERLLGLGLAIDLGLLCAVGVAATGGSAVAAGGGAAATGGGATAGVNVSIGNAITTAFGATATFIGTEILDMHGTRETMEVLNHINMMVNEFLSNANTVLLNTKVAVFEWPWQPYIAFWYDPRDTRLYSFHTIVAASTLELQDAAKSNDTLDFIDRRRDIITSEKHVTLNEVKKHLHQVLGPPREESR